MESSPWTIGRRTVLGTIVAGGTLSVAGCIGDDEQGGNDDEQSGLDEPVSVPDDRSCAICNMAPEEYPEWNAQLAHEDGSREFFCSAGCLSAYYPDPERFDGPDSSIVTAWVTDFETGELFDASAGYFVRVTDPDHVDDIMMMNPTPFADRDDAEAFTEEFDEYDEDDIITIEEFDHELARFYRSRFFEEHDDDTDGNH